MRRSSRGSSLLEVLLALSLIVISLVIMAGVFPFSYTADQKAWKKASAHRLAQTALEQSRESDFETLADSVSTQRVENTNFRIEITYTDTTAPPVKAKNVRCRVTWETKRGQDSYQQEAQVVRLSR